MTLEPAFTLPAAAAGAHSGARTRTCARLRRFPRFPNSARPRRMSPRPARPPCSTASALRRAGYRGQAGRSGARSIRLYLHQSGRRSTGSPALRSRNPMEEVSRKRSRACRSGSRRRVEEELTRSSTRRARGSQSRAHRGHRTVPEADDPEFHPCRPENDPRWSRPGESPKHPSHPRKHRKPKSPRILRTWSPSPSLPHPPQPPMRNRPSSSSASRPTGAQNELSLDSAPRGRFEGENSQRVRRRGPRSATLPAEEKITAHEPSRSIGNPGSCLPDGRVRAGCESRRGNRRQSCGDLSARSPRHPFSEKGRSAAAVHERGQRLRRGQADPRRRAGDFPLVRATRGICRPTATPARWSGI